MELTLGTRKIACLLTRGNGTVDMVLERRVTEIADLVIGFNVLLDGLTAVGTPCQQRP